MFCYFCGKEIPDHTATCPHCGHSQTIKFTSDYAYISNEPTRPKILMQYINTFLNTTAPLLIITSLYFWIFYYIEHNYSSFSSLNINIIYILLTLLICGISITGFAYLNKKKLYPPILEKFNITASITTGILCFVINYFFIYTALGNAITTLETIQTYRVLWVLSIISFLSGIVIMSIQLHRKVVSFHLLSNCITVGSLFEFSFYYSAFNYSVNGSDLISFILYCLPLLGGTIITLYFILRRIVKKSEAH